MNNTPPSRTLAIRLSTLILGLVLGSGTGQVVADDTEIFFPEQVIQDDDTVVRPNLLFLMDTSGSMAETDGLGVTRLQRMKDALTQVINSLGANINVGLGRLSGSEGGAILFPTADLEAAASDIDTSLRETVSLSNSPASTGGEAYQNGTSVALGPSANNQALLLGSNTSGTLNAVYVINHVYNEAEQYSTNSNKVDTDDGSGSRVSDDIELYRGANGLNDSPPNNDRPRYVGLRFEGVALPTDAAVTSAKIIFTCDATNQTGDPSAAITISGENVDNSLAFENSGNNVWGRSATTSVSWTPSANAAGRCSTTNSAIETSNLKTIVDAIRGRSGWVNGNAMTFLLDLPTINTANQRRTVRAFQGGNSNVAPRLQITYTTSQSATQQFGLRFENVMIPRGVTLSSARVQFRGLPGINPLRTQNGSALAVQIGVTSSSAAFTTAANAVSGAATGSTVTWNVPTMDAGVDTIDTPSLTTLIGARTSQTDWCGGHALNLTFKVTGTPAGLRAFSTGVIAGNGPVLSFSYSDGDPALDNSCTTRATTRQVTSSENDANQRVSNGSLSVNANPMVLGMDGNNAQIVGMRFDSLQVPAGSRILSAYVEFTAAASDPSGNPAPPSPQLRITGQSTASAAPFQSGLYDISNRRTNFGTTATVNWTPDTWTSGLPYRTPDISSVVQEIVNRGDWANGNALALLIDAPNTTASNSKRRARSYDTGASSAPRLIITAEMPTARLKVRDYLNKLIAEFPANGNTPVPELLYEAAQYWRGGPAHFGKTRGDGNVTPDSDGYSPAAAHRISGRATFAAPPDYAVPASLVIDTPAGCTADNLGASACANEKITSNSNYQSPFTDLACSTNAQILLSDGQPNNTDASSVTLIRNNLLNNATCAVGGDGACASDIAAMLHNNDQSSLLDGTQTVTTYTVGLADLSSAAFLRSVATAGGGSFFAANSTDELVNAFSSIVQRILDIPTTFVAPTVSVNSFNRLTDRNEIYFALFRPKLETRWEGNFKRYKIGAGTDGKGTILDATNAVAVDPGTGFFRDTAQSVWSTAADGNNVGEGGILDKFPTTRTVYTNTGTASDLNAGPKAAPTAVTLTATENALTPTNTAVTKALLGDSTMPDGDRTNIINYTRGIDALDNDRDNSTTDQRYAFGDPLHSEPALVTYGGTEAAPDSTAFVGTNEGGLHAINAQTGVELWSFVPQELLPNLRTYAYNTGNYKNRPYGVDGPITPLFRDTAGKHYSFYASGRSVLLYFGLRMGGRQYYAMDVTDRAVPKLKWVIRGGGTGAYRELGESWGRAVPARITVGGVVRSVIVLSGGYDRNQDNDAAPTADSMGRAVFIVDADTGERIWWGGKNPGGADAPNTSIATMDYSIPGTPAVVDLDGDGLADRIYVADTGAQIFRIDLDQANSGAANLATATRIATLGGTTLATGRRFYQSPDVVITRAPGSSTRYLSIAIGSGYRGHPLQTQTEERFYVLRDPDVNKGATSFTTRLATTPLTNANLVDVTTNAIGGADSTKDAPTAKVELGNADGFYVRMQETGGGQVGEKVLSDAQTFDGKVLFTTFTPAARSTGQNCRASSGLSRFYLFSIIDGQPVQNLDEVGSPTELTQTDRYTELAQGGLAPTPVILFPDLTTTTGNLPNTALVCSGTECLELFNLGTQKTYWIKRQ
jgi:type IV pilus assembly protein PilY1